MIKYAIKVPQKRMRIYLIEKKVKMFSIQNNFHPCSMNSYFGIKLADFYFQCFQIKMNHALQNVSLASIQILMYLHWLVHLFFICLLFFFQCLLLAGCFMLLHHIINHFQSNWGSPKIIIWISSMHVVFNLYTLLNIWNLSNSTHTPFSTIQLFQFNFLEINNQDIHMNNNNQLKLHNQT